jgi:hypothetical protein
MKKFLIFSSSALAIFLGMAIEKTFHSLVRVQKKALAKTNYEGKYPLA